MIFTHLHIGHFNWHFDSFEAFVYLYIKFENVFFLYSWLSSHVRIAWCITIWKKYHDTGWLGNVRGKRKQTIEHNARRTGIPRLKQSLLCNFLFYFHNIFYGKIMSLLLFFTCLVSGMRISKSSLFYRTLLNGICSE